MPRVVAAIVIVVFPGVVLANSMMGEGKWVMHDNTFILDREYPEYEFFLLTASQTHIAPLPLEVGVPFRVTGESRASLYYDTHVIAVPRSLVADVKNLKEEKQTIDWIDSHSNEIRFSRTFYCRELLLPSSPHERLETTFEVSLTEKGVVLTDLSKKGIDPWVIVGWMFSGVTMTVGAILLGSWLLRRAKRKPASPSPGG